MKYFKYFLMAGVALISLSSNHSGHTEPSEGIYPGDLFPNIENLKNEQGTTINLSDLRGQKVLVNFWAAYDSESRKDNVLFSNLTEKSSYHVKMISVSFDKSESVFMRTVAIDKVDIQNQFWADGQVRNALTERYQLNKGFKNYLIDESGKIVAMNIDPQNLDQLLKRD